MHPERYERKQNPKPIKDQRLSEAKKREAEKIKQKRELFRKMRLKAEAAEREEREAAALNARITEEFSESAIF